MMKRLVYPLAILSILLFACNLSTTVTPPAVTAAPVASEIPTVVETQTVAETPTATESPVSQANVNCHELALFLDPALASGFNCQTVPELSGGGPEVNPEYTELSLQGYTLSDRFFTPKIAVFSVQKYTGLVPDVVGPRVAVLQSLIGGGPVADSELPLLPVFEAEQEFHAQYQVIPFANGSGIRYLTEYAQNYDPINNHDMIYTFQGLTSDGKYWVSAILPISNPILPVDGTNPPNGQSWDDFGNNFAKYVADITAQLNAQAPKNYSPTITMLDALVTSIRIQP